LDRTITLASLWERIWSKRKGIILLALVAAIATGVVVFLMPTWYKADAELLPPTEDETPIGLASLIRGVGLPGVKIPSQVSAGDVFVIILQSRRISDQMIQRFDLMKRYKKKFMEDAAKELHHHATFKLTDAGTIRISVEDTDKKRAADMANSYIEFLDRFNREARMTKGRRTRLFIESRLADTKSELAAAEQRLAQYQVKNKAIALTPGASSAVEQGARMLSRRMALQIRLGIVRGYASVGVEPDTMGIGPAPAIRKAAERAGIKVEDIDLFEINEAFAGQYLAVEKDLDLDRDKVNVNGGAIGLGHPLGATGTRLIYTLIVELGLRGKKFGVASACIGGGQGMAVLIEKA